MPYFAVVIPTFNRVAKLREAVRSVLEQSFGDFELLVMDDGSTDATEAEVRSWADARIRYEWGVNSGGPATPRNRGLDRAAAPWISFLDADDIWYPERLQRVSEAIEANPSIDVVCHNEVLHVLDAGTKAPLRYGPVAPDFYRHLLTEGNCLSTSAVTIRREFLTTQGLRFNEARDHVIVEDFDMWLKLAHHGARFSFIDAALGEYRIEADNISHATERTRKNLDVVLWDHVYNIQTFESDADKLWREVRARQSLREAAKRRTGEGLLRSCLDVLKIAAVSPLVTARHALAVAQRKAAARRLTDS